MRVVLVSNGLELGGAEVQTVRLAAHLRARGDDVAVLTLLPPHALTDELAALGVPVTTLGGAHPSPVAVLAAARAALRELRPDALVSFVFQSNVVGLVAGRLAGVPLVVTSVRNERFGGRHRELLLRALLPLGGPVVVNSQRAADSLVRRRALPGRRAVVVPNAVDLDAAVATSPARRSELRRALGVDDDDVVWLAAGRLVEQKDHATLLDAAERAWRAAPAFRLRIAGEGPRREALATAIEARGLVGTVALLGERRDMPDLLAAADGLVLSSRWEGMPNVVLEAMAASLPVVATAVGGVPEIVEDGRTGRLVAPGDAAALAAALAELSTTASAAARSALGAAGRDTVTARFAADAVGRSWTRLLDRRGPGATLFLQSYTGGGAQRIMLGLAAALADAGTDVELVVARDDGPLRAELPDGVRVVELGARRTLSAIPKLVRHLRRHRPAVLLSTLDSANVVAIGAQRVARSGTAVAVRAANTTSELARQASSAEDRVVYRLARRWYPHADALVAPSRGVADDLSAWLGIEPGRVRVIANPVVTPDLAAKAAEPAGHPWFAPGAPPVILAVGRLVPHKGFDDLLRAFALADGGARARLLVVGEGDDRARLEAIAEGLGLACGVDGEVDLPGFEANPFRFMARCHLFVLSSRLEGLPGALIQAMACGAPVVATDCPSGPREILDGGRYGTLLPPGDVPAMADALRAAIAVRPAPAPAAAWARYGSEIAALDYARLFAELEATR